MLVFLDLCLCFDSCVSAMGFVFLLTVVLVFMDLCLCFDFCIGVVGFVFLF